MSESLLEVAAQFFTQENWQFVRSEEHPHLYMGYRCDSGEWHCYAEAREDTGMFLFYSIVPFLVPPEHRAAAAELLVRAGYDLPIGGFEMDMEDGRITYRTSIDVEGDRLSVALVHNLVYANVSVMEMYLPAIAEIAEGSQRTPAEIVAAAEGDVNG